MLASYLSGRVIVKVGDITTEHVDAIVNAANSSLMGGAGVDGAIHARGGPDILDACHEIRQNQYPDGLPTGEAAMTVAGLLPAKRVIHTVGPIYGKDHPADELLASCYRRSLELAEEQSFTTIAFPAISTGVYGYPKDEAAKVVSLSIAGYFRDHDVIHEIRLVFFHTSDAEIFIANQVF